MKKLLNFVDKKLLKIWLAFLVVFIPVYPKLPIIGINNTWVYVRLEDFLIGGLVLFFLLQVLRKKISFYIPLELPIAVYWLAGLMSFLFSIIVLAPSLINFFPHVAALNYLRRIEYMILFFIGFSSVKSREDIKFFFKAIFVSSLVIFVYGIGQRFYIELWQRFPAFFEQHSFCFPSYQTTNEEFAKGVPLCLPKEGRITSLFGGHYDLAAYLVLVIPIVLAVSLSVKNLFKKIFLILFGFALAYLLIITASRISFVAYLTGASFALAFIKQKKLIIPFLVLSIFLLSSSSSSALERFAKTIRFTNLVIDNQGQVVGESVGLSEELKKKISKNNLVVETPPSVENLPTGTSYITLPGSKATSEAYLKNKYDDKNQKYKFDTVEISSVSGSFLIQRALVYDISLTTRFQAEWPNAWKAFVRNPFFGSGYSSITLASDSSIMRSLGETGILGFGSFASIFVIWFIFLKYHANKAPPLVRNFAYGVSGGLIGLFVNATFIDVFEASKVAETLWILLGVAAGGIVLYKTEEVNYLNKFKEVITSNTFLIIYLCIAFFIFNYPYINNFFVGDDLTWLRWAANSDFSTLLKNFVDSQGFFYRPVDKFFFSFLYAFFSFKPFGYHLFIFFLNLGSIVCVYLAVNKISRSKIAAIIGGSIFAFLPAHHPNIFWISTISISLSSFLILLGLVLFFLHKEKRLKLLYWLSVLLFLVSLLSYEGAVIFILLVLLVNVFFFKRNQFNFIEYLPYIAIEVLYLFLRVISNSGGFQGDYNYNLYKIIPNTVGNFFGYTMLFLFGPDSLALYDKLRLSLAQYYFPLSIAGIILIVMFAYLVYSKKFAKGLDLFKLEIFGIMFAFVSLLPFLPLGNINARYLYLGSVGFIILGVSLASKAYFFSVRKKLGYLKYLLIILGFVVAGFYYQELSKFGAQWTKASTVSLETLGTFRLDYEKITRGSDVYFVNIPIKYGEAYIFPVGLEDGLWFIYRNVKINIYKVSSLEEAFRMVKEKGNPLNFVFTFEDYKLTEIKNKQ